MGQVLVIKNADFTDNRVAVISFDGKPCTGIELEESSITVTGDQSVTVAYTVTPSDTTDSIVWTSSDPSVATAEGNVLTIVGIGSTTITATCGSFSDSLTLTADLYASPDWYTATPSIITDSSDNSIIRADLSSTAGARLMAAQEEENTQFELPFYDGNFSGMSSYPIRIPNNCKRIQITASNLYNNSSDGTNSQILYVDATELAEWKSGSQTVQSCKALSAANLVVSSNNMSETVNVPEDATGFALKLRLRSAPEEGTTIAEAGESTNLSVHFLPAAT